MPTFTGRYAELRKAIYKDTLGKKYDPTAFVWRGSQKFYYKTEQGFRTAMKREFDKKMAEIDAVEKAGYPVSGTISTWYPQRSYQVRGTLSFMDSNGKFHSVEGGPTSGGGYDKYSTVSARMMNSRPEFLKLLFDARAKKKTLPYGVQLRAGVPWYPYWEGGVGIECHYDVLKAMGYEVKWVRTGIPDSQAFTFELKKKMR